MCRSIQRLFNLNPPVTEAEIAAAARQYVRKVSGTTSPSRVNADAFAEAIEAITAATATLLANLQSAAPPRNREEEAARARARGAKRAGNAAPPALVTGQTLGD